MKRRKNPYSTEIAMLRDHLTYGIDPHDFSSSLEAFFEETDRPTPKGFDSDEPYEWMETKAFKKVEPAFKKWLQDGEIAKMDSRGDPDLPLYTRARFEKILPRQTWLIHYTNDIEDVVKGGLKGWDGFNQLALTTWFKKTSQVRNGYNFAFPVMTETEIRRADTDKYGKDFLIFQAAAVLIWHYGDEEYQAIFRGADVNKFIPVRHKGDHDFAVGEDRSGKPYFTGGFDKVIAWVKANAAQYGFGVHAR